MFAVRRYKVQWGAFAAFMAVVFGVSMLSFLYARDLLAYYGIGIFLGFVSNMIVRVAGTTAGGRPDRCRWPPFMRRNRPTKPRFLAARTSWVSRSAIR